PYTIVIPPPNVTGALHMGHALNNTLQDVLIRWRRMQGYNALWMPGTDHAGIATQAVVERLILQTEKKTRHDLGREELVKRIWAWKDKYEARILGQLRQLGASCDWERTRFTLDPICARAVRETFFKMFKDGLIFRGKRLVNWDAHLQTSVADDETYTEDTKGGFWTFKYPVKGSDEFIRFSTTRPETMLGDTAVCVHPSDERYKHLIGKSVTVPLVNRDIPIIADALLADPTLGTGCVKVTPAHDPNDYACYNRNPQIGIINILNPDGTINDNGGKYKGLDRYKAREAVIADMEALGLFEGHEERVIPLKYSDRSKTPIEPYLSDQWFVKMGDHADGKPGLARMAMDAVENGQVRFFPERYKNSYLDWLAEKRDWCISRQLWWGHRIPVWSKTCANRADFDALMVECLDGWINSLGKIVFTADEKTLTAHVCFLDEQHEYMSVMEKQGFQQDPDVLDTWFSSMLWPHSTLGWPEKTPELAYYYPTSTLVTSRDIITLWVARMVIAGLYNLGQVPFRDVYIHPKMLDGFGETMSKMKGNGIDPVDIIELYGADALRFTIAQVATETQDSRLPVGNVCPHCGTLVPVKKEHMYLRTKKIICPGDPNAKPPVVCGKAFRPGGPWPGPDPELPTAKQGAEKFELGRNFANKIWNAARFIMMNLDGYTPQAITLTPSPSPGVPGEGSGLPTEDRWILSRLTATTQAVTEQLEGYRFSDAARTLYDFIWSEFCDWYVEMAKGRLKASDKATVQRVLVGVLDAIVRLIHPIMPFVSESIWSALNEAAFERGLPNPEPATESVMIAAWPEFPADWRDPAMEASLARMQEVVRSVREVRNRYNIEPRKPLELHLHCECPVALDLAQLGPFISQLAGVSKMEAGPAVTKPEQAASHVTPEFQVYVSLKGLIDPAAEVKRLEKQLGEKRKQLQGVQSKLENANFVKNAPPEIVEQQKASIVDLQKQIAAIEGNIADLRTE
ncbi:MAG TPA: valine--tRNA ligase, partial [Gemmataceae bacterium]|nr:valine--tRNA ligase [Gemmataceae bacterium]